MRKTITTKLVGAILAVPLIIGLAACSGGGTPDAGAGTKKPGTEKITDAEDWHLAFAKCMRGEGVDVPDPDGNGVVTSTTQEDAAKYEAASETCITKLGEAPAAPGQDKQTDEEIRAEQLKTAKCFRDSGVDVPDPKAGELLGLQGEIPEDVLEKCIPGFGGAKNIKERKN